MSTVSLVSAATRDAKAQGVVAVPAPTFVAPAQVGVQPPGIAVAVPAPQVRVGVGMRPGVAVAVPVAPAVPVMPQVGVQVGVAVPPMADPDGDGIPGVTLYARGAPAYAPVMQPPPPPQQEMVPPPRRMGEVWVPGFWHWNGGQYVWVTGRWAMPPNPQYTWNPPTWEQRGAAWYVRPGHWGSPVDAPNDWYQPNQGFGRVRPSWYRVGTAVTGSLEASDFRPELGWNADEYAVRLNAGESTTFLLSGGPRYDGAGPLDVYLSVLRRGQVLAQDDDGAGYPHARISFVAPEAGVYVLRVTTAGTGRETGTYTLQSQSAGGMVAPVQMPATFGTPMQPGYGPPQPGYPQPGYPQPGYPQPGYPQPGYPQPGYPQPQPGYGPPQPGYPQPGYPQQQPQVYAPQPGYPQPGYPQPQPAMAGGAMPLAVGQAVNGTLNPGDAQGANGAYVDTYGVFLQPGQTVTFYARGLNNTDPMLEVVLDGASLAQDDDGGEGNDARIVFTPQRPGLYQVRVTTWGAGAQMGAYSLQAIPGVR